MYDVNETERQRLVDFGNYILSGEREAITSVECQNCVTHADVENYLFLESLMKSKQTL